MLCQDIVAHSAIASPTPFTAQTQATNAPIDTILIFLMPLIIPIATAIAIRTSEIAVPIDIIDDHG